MKMEKTRGKIVFEARQGDTVTGRIVEEGGKLFFYKRRVPVGLDGGLHKVREWTEPLPNVEYIGYGSSGPYVVVARDGREWTARGNSTLSVTGYNADWL